MLLTLTILLVGFSYSESAYAYVGPGMAGGVIAGVIGVLAALIIGLIALIWFPVKKIIKKLSLKKTKQKSEGGTHER
ncbi:hypothetical protein OAM78_04110 [Alphaproteobacteria bacterium]|nr:hypothetical protein [Alphaproteobacteria bacterium]